MKMGQSSSRGSLFPEHRSAVTLQSVDHLLAMAQCYRREGRLPQAMEIYWTLSEARSGTLQAQRAQDRLLELAEMYERDGFRHQARPPRRRASNRDIDRANAPSMTDANRYAQLLEAIGDAVISIDSHHRVTEFNTEAERVFGYAKTEILGESINVLLPERNRDGHDRHIKTFATEPAQRRLMGERGDIRGRRKDGQEFDAEIAIAKIEIGGELCFMAVVRDVSAHKLLERELHESAQHLKKAQQLANFGSWEHDTQNNKLTWSGQIYEILGLDPHAQQPGSELFLSKVHPDDRAQLRKQFNEALANRAAIMSTDLRIMRADGAERILHELSELVWGEHKGQLLRQVGTVQDVTEQRSAVEKLTQSEQSLANAQRIAHIGNWDWNIEAKTFSWSNEIYRIFGLQPEEFLLSYPAFLERVHLDDRDYLESEVAAALRRERPYDIHHRIVLPSGSIRTVREQGEIIFSADGRPLRMNGTVQDVTEQKRATDDLERSDRMLAQAQTISKSGSWEIDLTTGILRWSGGYYELLGLDPAQYRPDAQLVLSLVHPEDRDAMTRLWEQAMTGDTMTESADYRIVRPDGTEYPVHARAAFNRDKAGRLTRIVTWVQDVTEQRAAEKELQMALTVAEAGSRAKSEFLANMSHELRTPLNAIIGFSELLLMGASAFPTPEEHKEYLQDIHYSGQHLLEIVNGILSHAKAAADETVLNEIVFEVPEVIEWVFRLVGEQARAVGMELQLNAEPQLPSLLADIQLIRQALLNLVTNAIKFSQSGGAVRVQARQSDCGDLAISIADSGIGMSPQDVAVALTPFGQVDSTLHRRYEGTGLGLPLAKKFIELHDGELTIDSAPMKGTTVTVTFPNSRCRTWGLSSNGAENLHKGY